MDTVTSRRTLLTSVIAVPVVAGFTAAPATAAPGVIAGVTPAFAALIAESDRASEAAARFSHEVYRPVYEQCERQCAAVPHTEVLARYQAIGGMTERMLSTADNVAVRSALAAAKRGPFSLDSHGPYASAYHRSLCRLATAHRWRERKLERIRKASGLRAVYEQSDAYDAACFAAHDAVEAYPVATLPDLVELARYLEQQGEENSAALTKGIRRLAGEMVA